MSNDIGEQQRNNNTIAFKHHDANGGGSFYNKVIVRTLVEVNIRDSSIVVLVVALVDDVRKRKKETKSLKRIRIKEEF